MLPLSCYYFVLYRSESDVLCMCVQVTQTYKKRLNTVQLEEQVLCLENQHKKITSILFREMLPSDLCWKVCYPFNHQCLETHQSAFQAIFHNGAEVLQTEASLITKDLRPNTRAGLQRAQVPLWHADEFLSKLTLICDGWFVAIHRDSNTLKKNCPVAPDSDSDPPRSSRPFIVSLRPVPLLLSFDPAPPGKSL